MSGRQSDWKLYSEILIRSTKTKARSTETRTYLEWMQTQRTDSAVIKWEEASNCGSSTVMSKVLEPQCVAYSISQPYKSFE